MIKPVKLISTLKVFAVQETGFISNENISKDRHLNNSRLHLNRSGDAILASNIRDMIKKH